MELAFVEESAVVAEEEEEEDQEVQVLLGAQEETQDIIQQEMREVPQDEVTETSIVTKVTPAPEPPTPLLLSPGPTTAPASPTPSNASASLTYSFPASSSTNTRAHSSPTVLAVPNNGFQKACSHLCALSTRYPKCCFCFDDDDARRIAVGSSGEDFCFTCKGLDGPTGVPPFSGYQ
ncbi:UNVERIFIED_CONTAM: hypothetical protein HDU68_002915 [Siphonaria sp. JEL0065]|nr:hypothetical protein HDU68_002915 [Siphonaria sp. JEL0065]